MNALSSAVAAAARLFGAMVALPLTAVFFGPAHRLLPQQVRITSFGFSATACGFYAAAVLRHCFVAGQPLWPTLVGAAMLFFVLLYIAGSSNAGALTLYLAVSVGIDLTAAVLHLFGVDIGDSSVRQGLFLWELCAAAVAIIRFKRRGADAAA